MTSSDRLVAVGWHSDKVDTLLKRSLQPEQYDQILYYEPVAIGLTLNYIVLTPEKIYVTKIPPKAGTEPPLNLLLHQIICIELVENKKVLITGIDQKNVHHIKIMYKKKINENQMEKEPLKQLEKSENKDENGKLAKRKRNIWFLSSIFSRSNPIEPKMHDPLQTVVNKQIQKKRWKLLIFRRKIAKDELLNEEEKGSTNMEPNSQDEDKLSETQRSLLDEPSNAQRNLLDEPSDSQSSLLDESNDVQNIRGLFSLENRRIAPLKNEVRSKTALGNYHDVNAAFKERVASAGKKRRLSSIAHSLITRNESSCSDDNDLENQNEEIHISVWKHGSTLYQLLHISWIRALIHKTRGKSGRQELSTKTRDLEITFKRLCREIELGKEPKCIIFSLHKINLIIEKHPQLVNLLWMNEKLISHILEIAAESVKKLKKNENQKIVFSLVLCIMRLIEKILEKSTTFAILHKDRASILEKLLTISSELLSLFHKSDTSLENQSTRCNDSVEDLTGHLREVSKNILFELLIASQYLDASAKSISTGLTSMQQLETKSHVAMISNHIENNWNVECLISYLMTKILSMVRPASENAFIKSENVITFFKQLSIVDNLSANHETSNKHIAMTFNEELRYYFNRSVVFVLIPNKAPLKNQIVILVNRIQRRALDSKYGL